MSEVVLSYRAASADVKAVRLLTDAFKRAAPLEFRKRGRTRTWDLHLPRPDGLARLEYELEVERTNGTTETVVDPENPLRASAPFGERSVLELDGYERPVWLDDDEAPAGTIEPLSIRSRLLRSEVGGSVWSAHGVDPDALLPLLVVHDGPEYAEHSLAAPHVRPPRRVELELPPFRAALLAPPGDRNETYSASTRYANALACGGRPRAPALAPTPDLAGAASGWARASARSPLLHAHRVQPGTLRRSLPAVRQLLPPATDAQELGFPRFERISRFVGGVLRADRRRADPDRDDVRPHRGERREQPRAPRRARAPALRRAAHEHPDAAQLDLVAGHASTRTSSRSWSGSGDEPARALDRRRDGARLRALGPPGARVPLGAGAARGSTRSAAWSTRSRR